MILKTPTENLKANPKIHRTRLFRGKTAAEVHAQYGFRQRCAACDGPPVIKVSMMALADDVQKSNPAYWAALVAAAYNMGNVDSDGQINVPTISTTYGKMVKFSSATACSMHKKDLELTAAKAPSWVLVEIDRGPGEEKPIVQVL